MKRTKNLPETGSAIFVTDEGEHVRVAVERPAWITTQVCIVRCDDNRVSWINQDKLISKAEWDKKKEEEVNDSEKIDQG